MGIWREDRRCTPQCCTCPDQETFVYFDQCSIPDVCIIPAIQKKGCCARAQQPFVRVQVELRWERGELNACHLLCKAYHLAAVAELVVVPNIKYNVASVGDGCRRVHHARVA